MCICKFVLIKFSNDASKCNYTHFFRWTVSRPAIACQIGTSFEIVLIVVVAIAFVLWMIRRNVKDEQDNSPVLGDILDKKDPNRDVTTDR